MSDNRINYVPPLPTFIDNAPLEASALNALTYNQEYVNQRNLQVVVAAPLWLIATDYYVLHTSRYVYLHIQPLGNTSSPVFRVLVNGKRIAQVTITTGAPSWTGTFDLEGNDLDSSPMGLTYGKRYTVRWEQVSGLTYEAGDALLMYKEMPADSASLTLPETVPSFADGQVLTAAKLNALVSNTRYLMGAVDKTVNAGFQFSNTHIQAPSNVLVKKYRIVHTHRYLVVRAILDMGYVANDLTFEVKWNGSTIHSTTRTKNYVLGDILEYVTVYLDLSTYNPTVGTAYTIELNAYKAQWDDFTRLHVVWVGQSSSASLPTF